MLGLIRSMLATRFRLGLTCFQSKPPPGEEQALPLPSPCSYVMIWCCPTHPLLSLLTGGINPALAASAKAKLLASRA